MDAGSQAEGSHFGPELLSGVHAGGKDSTVAGGFKGFPKSSLGNGREEEAALALTVASKICAANGDSAEGRCVLFCGGFMNRVLALGPDSDERVSV